MERLRCLFSFALVVSMALLAALPATAQNASSFRYVIPRFSAAPGSELIVANLTNRLATAEFTLADSGAGQFVDLFVNIQAGTQARFTSQSFGLSSFGGSIMVTSSVPLSVVATPVDSAGRLETVQAAATSTELIIPFGPGNTGSAEVTVFNGEQAATSVVIAAIDPTGETVAVAQRTIPDFGTLVENTNSLFPQAAFSQPRNIAHIVVRATTNVFGSQRRIYAQAILRSFADPLDAIAINDPGTSPGIPSSSGTLTANVPFFAQGGAFTTMLQIINTSTSAGQVTLTARGPDGNAREGTNPAVIQIRGNGSVRATLQNIFNFADPGTVTGAITLQSSTPIVVAEGITTVPQGGFAIVPAAGAADTNFAFRIFQPTGTVFTGLTFFNPGATTAQVTLRSILEDGIADSQTTFTLEPFTSLTRIATELIPEIRSNGFLHASSNVPILVSGIEGRTDLTALGNLPATHSQSDYIPPDPTRFQITGTIRHNGVPFGGVNVQLTGAVSASAVTDSVGTYFFPNTPAGQYTVRAAAPGYTFSPSTISVRITNETSRNNDFDATLVVPTITAINPTAIVAGSPDTVLAVAADPITTSSAIVFEGITLPTTLGTASFPVQVAAGTSGTTTVFQTRPALTATIKAQTLAVPHAASVFVRTTGPGGSTSSSTSAFMIGSAAPVLTRFGVLPTPLLAGNAGFTTTITGSGFLPGVVVTVNGIARPTVRQDATTVSVTIPPDDLANGGFVKVAAVNPSPTVGPSNPLDLAVLNPAPGVLAISPTTTEVKLEPNSPPLTLNVTGFNFRTGAAILVGGIEVPTTFGSSSSLLGVVPASALQIGGVFPVSVRNPQPAVAESEAIPLTVNNLLPLLSSLDAGTLTYDVTRPTESFLAPVIFHGSNFGPNSIYEVLAPCAGTTFGGSGGVAVSSHEAIVGITIACAGVYQVRVRTPQPGGGVSEILSFNVATASPQGAPIITTLTPSVLPAGSATFTMTVSGSNFVGGAVVSFGTSVLFPTSVTATAITVTVPGYLVTQVGLIPVTVTNPGPTGSSNRVLFTVN
jgi:hypothetical protein